MSYRGQMPTTRAGLLLAAAMLFVLVLPDSAHTEDQKVPSSLDLIPADAAFYGALLRNREQWDAFVNSKTWTRLAQLPYYQKGLALLKQQYEQSDNFADLRQWMKQAENRALLGLLAEAVSTEIFYYGGSDWIAFLELMQELNAARYYGQFMQLLQDAEQASDRETLQKASVREMLRVLAKNPDKLKFPDFVIGFKINDTNQAEAQIKRLEPLGEALAAWQPMMQGRIKRVKIGDSHFLTLTLDGSMIPWEQIDWQDLEEESGEFENLRKNLKKLKLMISLGVRHGFLLVAFGSTTAGVTQLGSDRPRLNNRPELKPLLRAADKRLTSISYRSKALAAQTGTTTEDLDSLTELAEQILDAADVPEKQRKAILKDVSGLVNDLKKNLSTPGASLSFSYLTPRGYESYDYQYGDFPDRDSSQILTLLDHVGSDPILAVVGRSKGRLQRYQTLSKWTKILYGHVEPIVLEKLEDSQKQKYQEIAKQLFPLLERGDAITVQMLLPSLADGQIGFVLDAKWKSKRWHPALETGNKLLPMPELALLVGVRDRALLEKAMKSYAKLLEDTLTVIKEKVSSDWQPPFTELPQPQLRTRPVGQLYFWRLPQEWHIHPRVALTAGLSEKVGLIAISVEHAERLLTATPLKVTGGPLADRNRPLAGASYFNWPALVDALSPWLMFALEQTQPELVSLSDEDKKDDAEAQKKQYQEIVRHVRVILDALKAFHLSTSATYIQDGMLITHSETIFSDK